MDVIAHYTRIEDAVKQAPIFAYGALLVFTVFAYWPGLSAGFVWEDITHVVANDALRSVDGLTRIWTEIGATQQYYPLFYSLLWLEFQTFELAPLGYHVVGVLLHAANALLVFTFLRRLSLNGAWLIAAIFAVHPINVESAVFVTEQSNLLGLSFCLLTLITWSHYAGLHDNSKVGNRHHYVLCLLLFVCALLAKTITVTLPVVMTLLLWRRHGRLSARHIAGLVPFFGVAVVFGLITIWIERTHLGAQGGQFDFSALERILIAGRSAWFYVGKLAWPVELSPIYVHWDLDPRDIVQWLFPVAGALVVAVSFVWRDVLGRGVITAVAIYLVVLFPTLGLVDYSFMRYAIFVGDHFQYLAGIALITLAVRGAIFLGRQYGVARPLLHGVAAAALLGMAAGSWQLAKIYENPETFWVYAVSTQPDAYLARNNYGAFLASTGRRPEALSQYSQALERYSDSPGVYANMGTALVYLGRVREGVAHYERAIELLPNYPQIYTKLGNALELLGKRAEAVREYELALEQNGDDAAALNNLAWLLAVHPSIEVRDGVEAVKFAKRVYRLIGDDVSVLDTLAAAHAEAGDFERAIAAIDRAIDIAARDQLPLLQARKALFQEGQPLREY